MLFSEVKIRSLLSDLYNNDQLKINLLLNAFKIGIIDEMRNSFPLEQVTKTRLTKRIVTDFGVSSDNASWAVDTWIMSMDQNLLDLINEAEKDLRTDKEQIRKQQEEEARLRAEEEQKRKEAEEQALEEKKRSTPDKRLKNREDYTDYYINPQLPETTDCIYVPCGFGKGDNGFLIYGIKKALICNHKDANVYALVYNYLVRNSSFNEDDIPQFLQEIDTVYELDYQSIYRLAITLLQMVRHNLANNGLILNYKGDAESLKYAVALIDNYSALFCRLIGITPIKLKVSTSNSGIPISLNGKTGIYIKDNKKNISNARELWIGRKINYHLTKDNLPDLEYILHEISDFEVFKEGQFSAICDMLSCKKHSVCIMPTGSGKSLIFYFASLLQPLPIFVISPTDILIQDQIRNLKAFHRIDNVAHLKLNDKTDFSKWDVCNSINYITPMTFQNRNLLVKFRYLNAGTKLIGEREEHITQGASVSYIVLDEIHCLSNWGHDFRPEYLMLSKYLNNYFDHITFLGFTATANYTVVEDVQKQLNIPQDNFFSPISFEHYNVSYDYRVLHNEDEMLKEIADITASLISRNERTIVFTKNDSISEKVADAIGWEADIFSKDNPSAYYHFAAGKSKILVASDELGIGINLPDIKNVIHFGLPLSKNEYVQEIGRAGRANENVTSYILYLDTSEDNVPNGLLKRDTPIHTLSSLLQGYENDYTYAYQKLSDGAVSDEDMYNQLIEMYKSLSYYDKALFVNTYSFDTMDKTKKLLYMLYLCGYVNDWYSYSFSKDNSGIDILVDVCCTNTNDYRNDSNKMLNRMKDNMYAYFEYMGNNRESIARVQRAKTPEEIFRIYVNWYYKNYLYHHNEQFLDLFDFIVSNSKCDRDKITEEIKDYFVLPFAKIKSDEILYNELTPKEIIIKASTGIGKNTLTNLERINTKRYSYKYDLALLCGNLRMNGSFDENRLNRIIPSLSEEEIDELYKGIVSIYAFSKTETKIALLNYMEQSSRTLNATLNDFFERIYQKGTKDEIYYGIMSYTLNKFFKDMRRASHV